MEERPSKLDKFFKIISGAVILALAFSILWFKFNKDTISFTQSLNIPPQVSNLLQSVQKQINSPGTLIAKVESNDAYLTNAGVFSLTNNERVKDNEKTLLENTTLDLIATKRLNDMFAKGYFEHVSPTGQSASTVAADVGYQYITIGENIAMGNFANDSVLVAAWMASPGHRANILNVKYTELGVAVGKGLFNGKSTWIGVQIFGRPISACPAIDADLKDEIDSQTNQITASQTQLENIQTQMSQLESDGEYSEYNSMVNEYNGLAHDVNNIIVNVKSLVVTYNAQVKAFNDCSQSPA